MSTPGGQFEAALSEPTESSTSIDSRNKEPRNKRRKLSQENGERPKPPVFIRPAPVAPATVSHRVSSQESLPGTRARPRTVLNSKRSSALNLRNYPSNPHPTGIAIWILQKIEQMRRDRLDSPPVSTNHSGQWSPTHDQNPFAAPRSAFQGDQPPPSESRHAADACSPQISNEYDAVRLQSQRDRKTKQRLDNWVKSK